MRLNASFPYVSPAARTWRQGRSATGTTNEDYHVVDGGYVDNEGMFTALDWLEQVLHEHVANPNRGFDRVLLVRILPFPIEDKAHDASKFAGWS